MFKPSWFSPKKGEAKKHYKTRKKKVVAQVFKPDLVLETFDLHPFLRGKKREMKIGWFKLMIYIKKLQK